MNPGVSRAASTSLPRLLSITLLQVQGAPPDVLPSPPAPCLAPVTTARCRCGIALSPCLPPLPHTFALRSKIILTLVFNVFASDLVNMGNHLSRPRILTARPLCTPPFFSRVAEALRHASHSLTLSKTDSRTRVPLMGSGHRQDRIYHQDHRSQPGASPRTCPRRRKVLPRRYVRSPTTRLPVRRRPVPHSRKPVPFG